MNEDSVRRMPRVPVPSFIQSMMQEGSSLWMKILGGALGTPLVVMAMIRKASRNSGSTTPTDWPTVALIVLASSLAGAVLGSLLSLKDAVHRRTLAGLPVPFLLKLMFGFGIWSLLLWIPVAIVGTLAVVIVMAATGSL